MMLFRWLLLAFAAFSLAGCAATKPSASSVSAPGRVFDFHGDTFAYANELVWEYRTDTATGRTTTRRREPPPSYTLHCFVVARAAKQFFLHARFDPALARTNEAGCERLVREVLSRNDREPSKESARVVIPGFASLRDLSAAHERMLKQACGGAWQSYFQRGHWRMLFPFSRRHQERTAGRLREKLASGHPTVVHLVRFPSLAINHAVLLFGVQEPEGRIEFAVYDPNAPEAPVRIEFDRRTRRFSLPPNAYFPGGRVDVYEVYRNAVF